MDIRRLGSRPLLLLNRSFAVRQAFDAACRIAEFKPNIRFESRTPHTLLALAEAGLGTAVVPSVLPTHRYKLQIVTLTYRNNPLREAYALVFDRQRARPPVADALSRALASYVREVFPISRPSVPRSKKARRPSAQRPGLGRRHSTLTVQQIMIHQLWCALAASRVPNSMCTYGG